MTIGYASIGAALLIVGVAMKAFAAQSDGSQVAHRAAHRHHVATNAAAEPNTASDVDRGAGMSVVEPQAEPECFGHGGCSDRAMPRQ